jgi:hypothetical protein
VFFRQKPVPESRALLVFFIHIFSGFPALYRLFPTRSREGLVLVFKRQGVDLARLSVPRGVKGGVISLEVSQHTA